MPYQTDRNLSDRYLSSIARIIKQYCVHVTIASDEEDWTHGTDLQVVVDYERIGVTVRRNTGGKYENEILFRASKSSGVKTELAKMLDGYPDAKFYGILGPEDRIDHWLLVDLRALRAAIQNNEDGAFKWGYKSNRDGQTSFAWFDISTFPQNVIIAQSESMTPTMERLRHKVLSMATALV